MSPNEVVVGPVVGGVAQGSARVLIEVEQDCELAVSAAVEDEVVGRAEGEFQSGRPKVLEISGIRPGAYHQISIDGIEAPLEAGAMGFRSLAEDTEKVNFGVVSCNLRAGHKGTELWNSLATEYVDTRTIDVLLHIGDQVYCDHAFVAGVDLVQRALRTGQQLDALDEETKERVRELFRNRYRITWGFGPTRRALAGVSNLMIWDDHDIDDDWGSDPRHRDPEAVEYQVGRLAYDVYREYQRALWTDTEPATDGLESHCHRWGDIGLIFLDIRGPRSFSHHPGRPMLGATQWGEIQAALKAPDGKLANVEVLIVASSVPLLYMGERVTNVGGGIGTQLTSLGEWLGRTLGTNALTRIPLDDFKDHWSASEHQRERIELLRLLRRWQQADDRVVHLLGGDVHVGGATDVYHNGRKFAEQLVTSPISSDPPGVLAGSLIRALLELEPGAAHGIHGSDGYSYRHRDFQAKRNYGLLMARADGANRMAQGSLRWEA